MRRLRAGLVSNHISRLFRIKLGLVIALGAPQGLRTRDREHERESRVGDVELVAKRIFLTSLGSKSARSGQHIAPRVLGPSSDLRG